MAKWVKDHCDFYQDDGECDRLKILHEKISKMEAKDGADEGWIGNIDDNLTQRIFITKSEILNNILQLEAWSSYVPGKTAYTYLAEKYDLKYALITYDELEKKIIIVGEDGKLSTIDVIGEEVSCLLKKTFQSIDDLKYDKSVIKIDNIVSDKAYTQIN